MSLQSLVRRSRATHDRPSIGPRISIRGTTGSGKTTLGYTLGQRLGLPVVGVGCGFTGFPTGRRSLSRAVPAPTCRRRWKPALRAGSVSVTRQISKICCFPRQTRFCGYACPSGCPSGASSSAPSCGRGPGNSWEGNPNQESCARVLSAVSLFCSRHHQSQDARRRTPCTS